MAEGRYIGLDRQIEEHRPCAMIVALDFTYCPRCGFYSDWPPEDESYCRHEIDPIRGGMLT